MMLIKLQVYLEKLLLALAVAILVAILLLVMADILARNLLGQPIRGVAEFLSQTLYLVVFLGLASAFRQGAFIRSDLIYRYPLDWRWKKGLSAIFAEAWTSYARFYSSCPPKDTTWTTVLAFCRVPRLLGWF